MNEFDTHRFDHQVDWDKAPNPFDPIIKFFQTLLRLVSRPQTEASVKSPPSSPPSSK